MKKADSVMAVAFIVIGASLIAVASLSAGNGHSGDKYESIRPLLGSTGLIIAIIGIGILIYEESRKSSAIMPEYRRIDPPRIPGATNFCEHCGRPVVPGMVKCNWCGTKIRWNE
ncbi:MAG: DUF2321 domain-containing protein [Candidatus Thermoplasmatota archaeon]|nr:DUF2321 domain-containing protein [Candidatus Thermoplasmatota archaeon]